MAAGDLTVTVVGSYDTLATAVAAMDAGNDALVTDFHQLIIEPGIGPNRYHVIKYVRAAA
jgi:hypothetical protein